MYWVYVLKCNDNGFYIGCTDNLKGRFDKHSRGYVGATKYRLPVVIEMYFCFKDKHIAFNFEKYLKSGSGRAFTKKHFENKLS